MNPFEPRMFIPGPTEVFPEVLAALSRPVISHRGPEIREITTAIFAKLQRLFLTENECFTALSAATGLMEGVVRNLSRKKVLATVCGAFSERQYKVALANGKPADALTFEPGRPVTAEAVDRALASGDYDLVTLVHSETSTGILNPVAEIAEVVRKHDDVLLAVDVVSSIAGAPVRVDDWGLDVVFAGTQKCLALPAGLTVFSVSPRAMERCAAQANRGQYFDFMNYRKMAAKGQSPATTNTSLMVALDVQLDRILAEGLEDRWARHVAMASYVRGRLERLKLFPDRDFMSPTLTVFENDRDLDIKRIVDSARRKGKLFGDGYGDLAGKTFRIGHMGDLQLEHMKAALDVFESVLAEQE